MNEVKVSRQIARSYRTSDGVNECWAWACEQFGNPGARWQFDTYQTYMFRDSADAMWFALRWS